MGAGRSAVRCGALGFVALLALSQASYAETCREDRLHLRGDWGSASFRIDLADTAQERSQGLMFVESMPADKGMLFIYDSPQRAAFWMRNTLIPLDMIFIGPEGVVRKVHHRAKPMDDTSIDGGDGILAVLEINGGYAKRFGIAEGTELRHEAFGQNAVWPCE